MDRNRRNEMNRNTRIARELVRMARELVADSDDRISIVINNNGQVEEISNSEFDRVFNAKVATLSNSRMTKAVIYVSPDVNATNPPKPGIKGLGTRLHNYCVSVMNRLTHERKIYDALKKHEEKSRYTQEEQDKGNYPLGCTIEKGKGVYGAGTGDNMTVEHSYIVTVYGINKVETEAFARELKNAFRQESVVVDYTNGNAGGAGNVENTSEYMF